MLTFRQAIDSEKKIMEYPFFKIFEPDIIKQVGNFEYLCEGYFSAMIK